MSKNRNKNQFNPTPEDNETNVIPKQSTPFTFTANSINPVVEKTIGEIVPEKSNVVEYKEEEEELSEKELIEEVIIKEEEEEIDTRVFTMYSKVDIKDNTKVYKAPGQSYLKTLNISSVFIASSNIEGYYLVSRFVNHINDNRYLGYIKISDIL